MKELKILAVVVFFTLLTYFLVEPYAHSQMHKHVESESFAYNDLPALTKTGNATRGQDLIMSAGCVGCHSIDSAGMAAPMDAVMAAQSYGVNPPDLSNAGVLYDAKFLADLIKNPAHALKVEHKYTPESGKMHPMVAYQNYTGGDTDQDVADMVAYLQSIAISADEVTPAIAYENACGRCHAVGYENWTQIGTKPRFKYEKDSLGFDIKVLEYQDSLKAYMGKLPPDLSMYIRSRGEHYISTFIENPQNHLSGTAMPRVGVTADSAEKVIEYLKDSGDTKRHEREAIGMNVMIFSIIFAIFALLWKKQVWRELH